MRKRVLTDLEKKRIEEYLHDGTSSQALRLLRYRVRKSLPIIEKEVDLLKRFLEDSPKR